MKYALVTSAHDFVGPPAVKALIHDKFQVILQCPPSKADQLDPDILNHTQVKVIYDEMPEAIIQTVFKISNHLDVLVSNDCYPAIHAPLEETDKHYLVDSFNHLMLQPYQLIKAAIPHLKQQQAANIIMITSCRGELPLAGGAIPDMVRAGANALVSSLAIELAPHNITVNAIAPNYLYSEAYFPRADFIDNPAGADFIKSAVPVGRLGTSEEMEELVSYLATMKGRFHTGSIIKFAGGWPAAPKRP